MFFSICFLFMFSVFLSLFQLFSGQSLILAATRRYLLASGGVISRTQNFGVISHTFLERVYFVSLFLHRNFCSCHFQRTGLKLLEPVDRTGLPLIIKKLEDFV